MREIYILLTPVVCLTSYKKNCVFAIAIFVLITFLPIKGSSQKDFYIPKSLTIPVHTHQREGHISLGLGGGYNGNISYAFSKHLALFANGTINNGKYNRTSLFGDGYKIYKNDYAVNGGIGYFTVRNKKKYNFIETYIGFGDNKINNNWYFISFAESTEVTKAKYWNLFWQLNAIHKGIKHEKAIAIRLSYSKYTNLEFWDTHPNSAYIKSRYENLWGINVDPVISYSYTPNKLKLNVQAGFSYPLSSVTVTHIDTHTFPTQVITVYDNSGITRIGLFALIGSISLQYNFDFKKK